MLNEKGGTEGALEAGDANENGAEVVGTVDVIVEAMGEVKEKGAGADVVAEAVGDVNVNGDAEVVLGVLNEKGAAAVVDCGGELKVKAEVDVVIAGFPKPNAELAGLPKLKPVDAVDK